MNKNQPDRILVRGARVHNLKNVDVDILPYIVSSFMTTSTLPLSSGILEELYFSIHIGYTKVAICSVGIKNK